MAAGQIAVECLLRNDVLLSAYSALQWLLRLASTQSWVLGWQSFGWCLEVFALTLLCHIRFGDNCHQATRTWSMSMLLAIAGVRQICLVMTRWLASLQAMRNTLYANAVYVVVQLYQDMMSAPTQNQTKWYASQDMANEFAYTQIQAVSYTHLTLPTILLV